MADWHVPLSTSAARIPAPRGPCCTIDPMKRPCERVTWVLMSYTLGSRGEISFEVWEALVSRDDDASLRATWTEARPQYATEGIHRVETTMELAPRITIRPLAANERLRAA